MACNLKVVVVGDGGVGKSSLIIRLSDDTFMQDYVPTVFDNSTVGKMHQGRPVTVAFWDTAGQEDYDRLRPLSYPQTDVFLVCFSHVQTSSLDNVQSKWLEEIRHHTNNVPCLLVGCQNDQHDATDLSLAQIRGLSQQWGMQGFLDTSALTRSGIDALWEKLLALATRPKRSSKSSRKNGQIAYPPKPLAPAMPPAGKAPWIYPAAASLGDDLATLLECGKGSDTSLKAGSGGKSLRCHRVILEASSPGFLDYFESDGTSPKQCSPREPVLRCLLRWLYTARADSLSSEDGELRDNRSEVRHAAESCGLEELCTFVDNLDSDLAELNESFTTYCADRLGKRAEKNFLDTGIAADVEIILDGGQRMPAHRAFLERCPMISASLQPCWQACGGSVCQSGDSRAEGSGAKSSGKLQARLLDVSPDECTVPLSVH